MTIRKTQSQSGSESWWFWCPGCETHHRYVTRYGEGESGPLWVFNGDEKRPTFTPSLLCNGNTPVDPERGVHRCHLFVTDGMVRYLNDCTHHLAGKTIPIEDPRFGD